VAGAGELAAVDGAAVFDCAGAVDATAPVVAGAAGVLLELLELLHAASAGKATAVMATAIRRDLFRELLMIRPCPKPLKRL
jgi:hypothetical protein